MIENVLWIGSIVSGGVISALAYLIALNQGNSSKTASVLTILGFFIGYVISQIIFGVISGATTTVYICFIDTPGDLKKYREAHYNNLEKVWKEKFPEIFNEEREPLNP